MRARSVLNLSVVFVAVLSIIVALTGTTGAQRRPPPQSGQAPPDVILLNGKIATVDADNSMAQAVAIRDGEFIAVGRNGPVRALARRGTEIIDLNGRTVLPGLIDGTLHGVRNGYHCFSRAVRHDLTFSRADALAAYAAKGQELPPDTWIFTTSGSWGVNQLDTPGMFTREELDSVLPNHPVFVQALGFSGVQVNTRALDLLGLSAGDPGVEVDPDTGEPTGRLTAPASGMASRAIGAQLETLTIDQQEDCLADFVREANRVGLTAWDDPGGNDPFDHQGRLIEALREGHGFQAVNQLWRDGRMNARVVLHLTSFGGLETVLRDTRHAFSVIGDDVLRIGGPGEEIMSAVGGVYPPDEYGEILRHLIRNRWNFQHHATQEITQSTTLDAWEAAVAAAGPIEDLHWAMLHPGDGPASPTAETLARLEALGAGVVPTNPSVRGGTSHPPYKRIFDSGTRMCLGTDAMNAGPYPPFINMWYTISGKTHDPDVPGVTPEQRLTREEALRATTANCAWFVHQEDRLGSIEVGKHADLVVLSDDYFTVAEDDIRTLTSVLTIMGGRVVFADAEFAGLEEVS